MLGDRKPLARNLLVPTLRLIKRLVECEQSSCLRTWGVSVPPSCSAQAPCVRTATINTVLLFTFSYVSACSCEDVL